MENRSESCISCIHVGDNVHECFCAEECIDFEQWLLDETIIEREWEEMLEIIKVIYNNALGAKDSIQLGEDLYNRMGKIIEANTYLK